MLRILFSVEYPLGFSRVSSGRNSTSQIQLSGRVFHGLLLDAAQDCRNGQPGFRRLQSAAAKVRNWLNMDAPDVGSVFQF